MLLFKITPVLLLALIVGAEKKIELEDIEEDNLKSENVTTETVETQKENNDDIAPEALPLDQNNGVDYSKPSPAQGLQQNSYVHQYAVTEAQEKAPVTPAPLYGPPEYQQAKGNNQLNPPMGHYSVPQYVVPANEARFSHTEAHYSGHGTHQFTNYQPEHEQIYNNYVHEPAYVAPTARTHMQPYSSVSHVYSVPSSVAPSVPYQSSIAHYQSAPPPPSHQNSHLFTKVDYPSEQYIHEDDRENNVEGYYDAEAQVSYPEPQEIPRYYNSRTPYRQEYTNTHSELPHPSPLLLKAPPSHLSHIPKALPMHRPWNKPVYSTAVFNSDSFDPIEPYHQSPFKRRPTSLLDSYVPSSVQVEYLKRGIINDPLVAYEVLSNSGHFSHEPSPRHFESGFLPNQAFHTAGGGSFYGHYKRSPKVERRS